MIEAHELTKVFHTRKKRERVEIRAADRVSFTCRPGEVYGLLGANGAGKTTTLRMLATILEPTAGGARVAGHELLGDPAAVRRGVGYLSTQTALYDRLTAREMVEYFGRLCGVRGEALAKRWEEISALLGMEEFEDQRCGKLSTGQKQRVSIARALVHDPPVMILDEPTAGLDVMAQRVLVRFIRRCREQRKTVLFSTHVMSEAEKLCDRLAIIHEGRIIEEGTLEDLRGRHGENDLEELFIELVGAGEDAA